MGEVSHEPAAVGVVATRMRRYREQRGRQLEIIVAATKSGDFRFATSFRTTRVLAQLADVVAPMLRRAW